MPRKLLVLSDVNPYHISASPKSARHFRIPQKCPSSFWGCTASPERRRAPFWKFEIRLICPESGYDFALAITGFQDADSSFLHISPVRRPLCLENF